MGDSSDNDAPYEKAFAVEYTEDNEIDFSVPATSGNEYLRRVRQEAMGCPKVVVAEMDTSTFLEQQTVKVSAPGGLLPVPETYKAPLCWQKMQIAEFAALRQKLIQFKALIKQQKISVPKPKLPQAKDAANWCRLCFGRVKLKMENGEKENGPTVEPEVQGGEGEDGTPPLLHIIAHMNQHQVTCVIEYHTNWLEVTGFTSAQGRWLYALLANLEKPLSPEVCSWLRRLARLCSNIRGSLEDADKPVLKELNLIICLVARYFDQRDLADS